MKEREAPGMSKRFAKLFLCTLLALVLLAASFLLASCQKASESEDSIDASLGLSNPISSERAMENFLAKIRENNYSVSNKGVLKISVFSEDLVYFSGRNNLVYMTVNRKDDHKTETFVGLLDDDILTAEEISFYDEGHATEAISEKLLNCWEDYANGNVWDLFTNFPDEPLKFLIIDETLKLQILENFSGMGTFTSDRPDEMTLLLDAEDPTSAKISITFVSGNNPVNVGITFGIERPSDLPSDAWVNDESRTYPAPKTAWNDYDEVAFNAVFNQGYDIETQLMPFPAFATYAFLRDPLATEYYNQIRIRDSRATEADLNAYKEKLIQSGFVLETEILENGSEPDCYHKLLKDFGDGFYSYSSIYLEYNDGIDIAVKKYYNHKEYEGRDAVNGVILSRGFLPLDADDAMTAYQGLDFTYEFVEGLGGLFTYDLVFDVNIAYEDEDAAEAYLNAYLQKLLDAGYKEVGEALYELGSETYQNKVAYNAEYRSVGMLQFRFKGQKYLSSEEADAALQAAGFPPMELEQYNSTCKEITLMFKLMYNLDHKAVYSVALNFETPDDMLNFMDGYIDGKLIPDGYMRIMNPVIVKVPYKNAAYYNAEKGLIVAFNEPSLDSTFVSFEMIRVHDGFEPLA